MAMSIITKEMALTPAIRGIFSTSSSIFLYARAKRDALMAIAGMYV